MNSKVSLIVPVYNVEKYLPDALSCIMAQSYPNLEIILVDDGSTDASSAIVDVAAKQDSRITVIHQRNAGLSDARNAGIQHASGEYITFMDSDDIINEHYVANLMAVVESGHVDIGITSIIDFIDGQDCPSINMQIPSDNHEVMKLSASQALCDMLYQRRILPAAFGKIYKTDLFDDIKYPSGKLYEDIATTSMLIDKAGAVAYANYNDYYYRIRATGIQGSAFSHRNMDLISELARVKKLIYSKYPENVPAFKAKSLAASYNLIMKIGKSDKRYAKEYHYLWNEIIGLRYAVLTDENANRQARLAALLSYFGKTVSRVAYALFEKIKRRGE